MRFHPDKNKSSHSNDAFKKVSHAYTILSNEEKKDFYDKYGPEDEAREKMHQQQRYYYEQDERDPFEMFNSFFQGGFEFENGNIYRRQQQRGAARPRGLVSIIYQLIPIILFLIIYIVPIIFKSVSIF